MEDKQIQLSLHSSADEIYVFVDKQRMVQALYNVIINSIQYTNNGGQIQIRIEQIDNNHQQNEFVQIIVEDNGIGIQEEDIPYIFNRFYRADHSRTRPHGGTGLGLAIAEQNILVHQGNIKVNSVAGRGTVFTVNLPTSTVGKYRAIDNL
ncbi:cell wall metabolism sensor histidine kinase WalK [Neobacillus mesonae]|nr:cell wall metabolism sensor histidine kinase WalK [Neobacillus mesonae]